MRRTHGEGVRTTLCLDTRSQTTDAWSADPLDVSHNVSAVKQEEQLQ